MTAVPVPRCIFQLFQNEVVVALHKSLDAISEAYDIPVPELRQVLEKRFNVDDLSLIDPCDEDFRVTKIRRKKPLDADCRCTAMVKKNGVNNCCSFAKCKNSQLYCTRHMKKYGDAPPVTKNSDDDKNNTAVTRKLRKVY